MNHDHNVFLETAATIGRELCRDAIWANGRCNWLGWSMEAHQNQWVPAYKSFGPELYAGTCGVGVFLARLYALTGDRLVKETALGAVQQTLHAITDLDDFTKIGFYSGQTGVGYHLTMLGELLDDEQLVERGLALLLDVGSLEPNDMTLDVIGGSAGAIPAFIDLGVKYEKQPLLDAAEVHGKHLLKTAIESEHGWAWDTMHQPNQKPLTGYSHGAAGIVCALLELHELSGNTSYLEAAKQGLRYERASFSEQHRNWPDFRRMDPGQPADSPPSYTLAWCHGAPGIGMARIRTHQLLPNDSEVLREIEVAIQSTSPSLSQPVVIGNGNHSLCHGTLGNADLMLLAADELGRHELRILAENAGYLAIQNTAQVDLPWACGLMKAGTTPSLLLGLAGIGYFYLRLFDSKNVPSILLPTAKTKIKTSKTDTVSVMSNND